MTVTLRDFIAARDAEIKEQLKALRAEQKELQLAKAALDAQEGPTAASEAGSPVTIKDMARQVLSSAPDGLVSQDILAAIKRTFGKEIDRTSLSPQLSRLKDAGEVTLNGERWFTTRLHEEWQQKQMLEVFADTEDEEEYQQRRAHEYDRVDFDEDAPF